MKEEKMLNNNENENIIDIMKIVELEAMDINTEKYKLQCMLPDYIFNKLNEEEQKWFEQNVVNFPDLYEEIKDAKILFSQIEKFDYKKMMYDKSQYLPDRVVANLEKRNVLYKPWKPNLKRAIALGIFAAILLIYFYFTDKDAPKLADNIQQPTIQSPTTDFFTDDEKEMIADMEDLTFEDIYDNPLYLSEMLLNDDVDLKDYNDYYIFTINSALFETIQSEGTISLDPNNDYIYLLEELENMDEVFFQSLLNQMNSL